MKPLFDNSGISAITLRFAQMKRTKPVTPQMVVNLSPKRFKKPSQARRCFEGLERLGFVSKVDTDAWSITPDGSQYLKLTANKYLGENGFTRK